jgi:hypothetical protein
MRRVLFLAALAGCGSPLVDQSFRGAPLWSVQGDSERGGTVSDQRHMMALFFSSTLDNLDPEQMSELTASTTPLAVPSAFVLNVFRAPSPHQLVQGQSYAVGRVLVYDDLNRDWRREPGEPFVGIEPPTAVVWAATELPVGAGPGHGVVAAGFTSVLEPQPCSFQPPQPTTPDDCGVPLGSGCGSDSDCGTGGLCLKQTKVPWPAGYCIVPDGAPDGCKPGSGAYLYLPRYVPSPGMFRGFYGRACVSDGDCSRGNRDVGLYSCDPGLKACVPTADGGPIPVGGRVDVEPFCAGAPPLMPQPQ